MTNKPTYKIKVCGMKYSDNIQEVAQLNPDYIGFIFYEKSSRYVANQLDIELIKELTPKKVGVFVNATSAYVEQQVNLYQLNAIQLHGNESPEYCKALKSDDYELIKAFQIDEIFDFNTLAAYKDAVDYYLFDTKSNNYGGTGKQFDWNLLLQYDNYKPFFLSGGIGPNDATAIANNTTLKQLNIHALDINSKFENAAALKDITALKHFITTVKHAIHS